MLIVGDREAEEKTLSVRSRDEGDLGTQALQSFIDKAVDLNAARR